MKELIYNCLNENLKTNYLDEIDDALALLGVELSDILSFFSKKNRIIKKENKWISYQNNNGVISINVLYNHSDFVENKDCTLKIANDGIEVITNNISCHVEDNGNFVKITERTKEECTTYVRIKDGNKFKIKNDPKSASRVNSIESNNCSNR